MYARIKDNIVVEKTTLDPALYYSATASSWVPCPDDTPLGAIFDGSDVFNPPLAMPEVTEEEHRIAREAAEAHAAGLPYPPEEEAPAE